MYLKALQLPRYPPQLPLPIHKQHNKQMQNLKQQSLTTKINNRAPQDRITGLQGRASLRPVMTGHVSKAKVDLTSSAAMEAKVDLIGLHVRSKVGNVHKAARAVLTDSVHKADKAALTNHVLMAGNVHKAAKEARADSTDQGHKAARVDSISQGRVGRDVADLILPPQKKKRKQNQLRTISARNGTKAKLQTKPKKTKKTMNAKKTARHLIAGVAVLENL